MQIIETNLKTNPEVPLQRYNNNPKSVVVHHIEASCQDIENINDYHISRGWSMIGYHYYIRKNGQIFKGRPDDSVGAHCLGFNNDSLGVAFEGNYDVETEMPSEQFNSWCWLKNEYLFNKYGSMPVYGHREKGNSECPGKYFPLDKVKSAQSIKKENGYVVSQYLPYAWEGYSGIDLSYVLKYFNGCRCYMRSDNNGMWIETQELPMSECEALKESLGSWFCKIV